jgi:hypothetical protein
MPRKGHLQPSGSGKPDEIANNGFYGTLPDPSRPEISDDRISTGRTPVKGLCKGYDQISPSHSETRSSLKRGEICLPSDAIMMRVATVGIPIFLSSRALALLVLWSATSTLDGFDTRLRPCKLITRVLIVLPPNHMLATFKELAALCGEPMHQYMNYPWTPGVHRLGPTNHRSNLIPT